MKTLCKIKKQEYDKFYPVVRSLVMAPKFICRKCLRVASDKKALCKPEKL
jgi:hypothetical protein